MPGSKLAPLARRALDRHHVGVAGRTGSALSALLLVSCRGTAIVRCQRPVATNDNMPGTITPDDGPFFLALGLICAGIVALAVYVGMSGPDDVMAVLRR